jgi:RIO kinase 1
MAIAPAQFDNAQEDPNGRHGTAFIDKFDLADDHEALAWSDDDQGATDVDEVDETYDVNRVEDEDWEIAERGNDAFILFDCQ